MPLPLLNVAEVAFIISIVSSILTYFLTHLSIRYLNHKGVVVEDYHKPNRPKVPRPGGPALLTAILASEAILYFASNSVSVLAVILTTAISCIVGLVDDFHTLGGVVKPLILILGGVPIILLGAYSFHLTFPFFGMVRIPLIYPILVLIAIPLVANTVNTIDVLNGVMSGFTVIATIPLLTALVLKANYIIASATLPLILASLAFYIFHRYPSKIFPGNSGTLFIGGMYAALTIMGGVEFVGVIALLPAILNSFFFLSSVRRFIEHRQIKARPTVVLNDYRLAASHDPDAPVTLVRLILAEGPMGEKEVAQAIFKISIFSSIIAVLTACTTWWF